MESTAVLTAKEYLTTLLLIFMVGTLGGKLAERLRIPDVAVYILIGILLGPAVTGLVRIDAGTALNQIILLFGASFILFHGGTVTRLSVIRQVWLSITLLSTLGVVVTAFTVAAASAYLLHLPFLVALLLGSLMASTDPAVLVPIFQKFPVRARVAQTIISESAFNDAVGAIMTTVVFSLVFSAQALHWGEVGLQFVQLALGGILVGVLIGYLGAFLIAEHKGGFLRNFTPMVIVLTVLSAYLLADRLHTSGFMSVFTAGLVMGNARSLGITIAAKEREAAHFFIDPVSLKMRMLIFILLGSQVDFSVLRQYVWQGLLIVVIFIFLARPLAVLFSLLPDRQARWSSRELLFFFWIRETGVIPAALVGMIVSSPLPQGKLLAAVTFMAILLTITVQASTTPALARRLNLLE